MKYVKTGISVVYGLKNKVVGGKKILSRTISVNTVESEIAKPLEVIQNKFKNIEIGSILITVHAILFALVHAVFPSALVAALGQSIACSTSE